MRLGGFGQRSGGRPSRVKGTYHPAAFERAADSTKGVETQGLGISGDDKLPMVENPLAFGKLLRIQSQTSGSRLLKDSRSTERRGNERRTMFRLVSDRTLPNIGAQILSSW